MNARTASVRAYSLIEVLIAGGILLMGISAAALMAHALLAQEESSGFALRAFNAQEQAARLWQLGLSPTTITNIFPERCSANSTAPGAYSIYLGFSAVDTNVTGVGTVEMLNPLRIVFHSGYDSSNNVLYRTNDIIVVRPSIR
jgi:Tfp pilus assembly protein PilV